MRWKTWYDDSLCTALSISCYTFSSLQFVYYFGAVMFTIEGGDMACGCPKMRAIEHLKGALHKRNALAWSGQARMSQFFAPASAGTPRRTSHDVTVSCSGYDSDVPFVYAAGFGSEAKLSCCLHQSHWYLQPRQFSSVARVNTLAEL